MADFNNGTTQVSSPFKAVAPSVDTSAGTIVNAVSSVLPGALNALGQAAKAKQDNQVASYIQGFREQQLLVSEAVEQGRLTAAQGTSRMRSNLLKYTSGNPLYADDIQSVHKEIVTTSGLGKEVVEGSTEDQAFEKVTSDAITSGFVKQNATPDQVQEGVNLYLDDLAAQRELSRVQAETTLQSSKLGITSAQMSIDKNRNTIRSQQALTSLASTQTPKFRLQMNQLVEDLRTGKIDQEEALILAQDSMSSVESFLSQVGVEAGGDYINALAGPIKNIYENTVKHLKGEFSLAVLENRNATATATATAGWLSDPERAKIVAGSRLFPNSDVVKFTTRTTESIANYLKAGTSERGMMDVFPTDETSVEGYRSYLKGILTPNIHLMLNGNLDEETTNELNQNIGNMIKSIPAYSGKAENLSDFKELTDFLADPSVFGRYVEKAGGIPTDSAANAYKILQEQYEIRVVDVVKREYTNYLAQISSVAPTGNPYVIGKIVVDGKEAPDVIEPSFSGGGVVFKLRSGVVPNVEYNRILRGLNSRVAPAVNKLVHLGAHFNGNRDYKGVYNDNYSELFGIQQETTEE